LIQGGFESIFYNPINQKYIIASMFLSSLINASYEYFNKLLNTRKRKLEASNEEEDIFKNFIAKKDIIDNLNLMIMQIKDPNMMKNKKIRPVKGVLVYGKPGTGKTLIARCLEQIQNVNFIPSCASDYVEIFVGSGPKKVREIFEKARENAPSIIFIDELEAIGLQRSSNFNSYTNNIERYSTLNSLLSEMDGLNDNENILVIAATNREDLLDAALVRPGRFDMKIYIDLPDFEVRLKIYRHYLNNYGISSNITEELLKDISSQSENFSGAVIENVVTEAARLSFSKGSANVEKDDLLYTFRKNKTEFCKFKQYELLK